MVPYITPRHKTASLHYQQVIQIFLFHSAFGLSTMVMRSLKFYSDLQQCSVQFTGIVWSVYKHVHDSV